MNIAIMEPSEFNDRDDPEMLFFTGQGLEHDLCTEFNRSMNLGNCDECSQLNVNTNSTPEEENVCSGLAADQVPVKEVNGIQPNGTSCVKATEDENAQGSPQRFESKLANVPDAFPRIPTDNRTGCLEYNIFDRLFPYLILARLGSGAFGDVVKARHENKKSAVAIKINVYDGNEPLEAKYEAEVLKKITNLDKSDKFPIIKLIESFDYYGHICIVTKVHGIDLWRYQLRNKNQPFPMRILKWISYQILMALEFLHKNNIIHCDLKADNFIFDSVCTNTVDIDDLTFKRARIRLIDFGSSVEYETVDYERSKTERDIQPFAYRAPEVFFGLGWNMAIDIWSLACIFLEFYNPAYKRLFINELDDNLLVQFKIIETMFGEFPLEFKQGENSKLFDQNGYIKLNPNQKLQVSPFDYGPLKIYKVKKSDMSTNALFDLLSKMAVHVPAQRITATGALAHPFFHSILPIIQEFGL